MHCSCFVQYYPERQIMIYSFHLFLGSISPFSYGALNGRAGVFVYPFTNDYLNLGSQEIIVLRVKMGFTQTGSVLIDWNPFCNKH